MGEDRGPGSGTDSGIPIDASLLDPATGLFAQPFFMATVDWRVDACRRVLRPLAVVLFQAVDGLPDGPVVPSDPRVVAAKIRDTVRRADVAGRLSDGSYGILLEDTPEDGALWAIERLRRALGSRPGIRTVRAGIACYPGQALTPRDLLSAARRAFASACEWPQDRIEVAVTTS